MDGSSALVLLPARFRKKIWVRRGSYLIVEQTPHADNTSRERISGSIETVLSKEDIKELQQQGSW